MKKDDLERCVDFMIVDGLIKEAEQDNADFGAALLGMDDDAFDELLRGSSRSFDGFFEKRGLHDSVPMLNASHCFSSLSAHPMPMAEACEECELDENILCEMEAEPVECHRKNPRKSRRGKFLPWLFLILALAAILAILLIFLL